MYDSLYAYQCEFSFWKSLGWQLMTLCVLCNLQPERGPKTVLLVVPTEMGQPTHSQHVSGHDSKHGHGAFVRSISQLCLKHASNHRTKVMSKWKVNKPHPSFSGFSRPRLNSCPCVTPISLLPPSPSGSHNRRRRQTVGAMSDTTPIPEEEDESWLITHSDS